MKTTEAQKFGNTEERVRLLLNFAKTVLKIKRVINLFLFCVSVISCFGGNFLTVPNLEIGDTYGKNNRRN
ncbi:MAG: hypothetical protein PF545_02290 [Elusimicrobia bacterium]|jgi:hypothetical protein|nr:hypothetical protein [Elusimicrobiota bacterium]